MKIELTLGFVTEVDDADWPLLSQFVWTAQSGKGGNLGKRTYASAVVVPCSGRREALHRFLMRPLPHEVVDHIDGDSLNNRRSNLRVCTQAENNLNRCVMTNNVVGVKGVAIERDRRRPHKPPRFRANVQRGDKRIRRSFTSLQEAEAWVVQQREVLHREYARHK